MEERGARETTRCVWGGITGFVVKTGVDGMGS